MDLHTGYTMKRRSITQVPITKYITTLVHKLEDADGIRDGWKIANKSNVILFDSSWIAGVDYVDEKDDDYNEDDKNKQEHDEQRCYDG